MLRRIFGVLADNKWAGIGALAAVMALAYQVFRTESPVPPIDDGSAVAVPLMEEFTVNSGTVEVQAIGARRVIFPDHARVVVPSDFDYWEINAEVLEIGRDVQIIASGNDGPPGPSGANGSNASSDCQSGQPGSHGSPGSRGGDAPNLNITTRTMIFKAPLLIENSGGKGGNGGPGGRGGNGGKADRSEDCRGGNGGLGGNGGPAGDGGSGGTLRLQFATARLVSESGSEEIDGSRVSSLIDHRHEGGLPGEVGSAGEGGNGGPGRGAVAFGLGAQPAGSRGRSGMVPSATGTRGGNGRGIFVVGGSASN